MFRAMLRITHKTKFWCTWISCIYDENFEFWLDEYSCGSRPILGEKALEINNIWDEFVHAILYLSIFWHANACTKYIFWDRRNFEHTEALLFVEGELMPRSGWGVQGRSRKVFPFAMWSLSCKQSFFPRPWWVRISALWWSNNNDHIYQMLISLSAGCHFKYLVGSCFEITSAVQGEAVGLGCRFSWVFSLDFHSWPPFWPLFFLRTITIFLPLVHLTAITTSCFFSELHPALLMNAFNKEGPGTILLIRMHFSFFSIVAVVSLLQTPCSSACKLLLIHTFSFRSPSLLFNFGTGVTAHYFRSSLIWVKSEYTELPTRTNKCFKINKTWARFLYRARILVLQVTCWVDLSLLRGLDRW